MIQVKPTQSGNFQQAWQFHFFLKILGDGDPFFRHRHAALAVTIPQTQPRFHVVRRNQLQIGRQRFQNFQRGPIGGFSLTLLASNLQEQGQLGQALALAQRLPGLLPQRHRLATFGNGVGTTINDVALNRKLV